MRLADFRVNGKVHIPTTSVWMSACEIADLFGVFSGKVNSHIKSIFKEGLLREDKVMQTLSFKAFRKFMQASCGAVAILPLL